MARLALALLLLFCAVPAYTQDLPITAGSIPGCFLFSAGNDVLDDPPSLYIQLGDGRVVLGQAMSFTQPIVPRQTMSLPYVDAAGSFQAGPTTLAVGGIELNFATPPTGTFRLESGLVHATLSGTALIAWHLDDGSVFQLTRQLAITTGQASANADGLGPLLLFGNTLINGVPFKSTNGAGAFATAFTIPKDLPQSVVDQLTALLAQQGLALDGSILLGAPVGLRITGMLTEANVAAPRIIPNGGRFPQSVTVSIECDSPGADVRYTTDGTPPTTGSAAYTGPFALTESGTIKARAFLANCNDSPITQATFTLGWPIPGDVDGNCRVNILDLITIRNRLGQNPSTGDNWIADVNRDGNINILDLIAVRNSLNSVCK